MVNLALGFKNSPYWVRMAGLIQIPEPFKRSFKISFQIRNLQVDELHSIEEDKQNFIGNFNCLENSKS